MAPNVNYRVPPAFEEKKSYESWKNDVEMWNSNLDTKNKIPETCIDGTMKEFKIINTGGNHFGIMIENNSRLNMKIVYL